MQIKAGDTVVVIAGKDKLTKDKKGNLIPTTGKVLKVFPKENCYAGCRLLKTVFCLPGAVWCFLLKTIVAAPCLVQPLLFVML